MAWGQEPQLLLDVRYQPKDACNICCPLEPKRVHSAVGFCFRGVFCSVSLTRVFATKTKWLPQWVWGGMCIVVRHGAGGGSWRHCWAVGTERCSVGFVQSERLQVFYQALGFQLVLFFPSPSSPRVNFNLADLTPSILQLLDPFAELLALLSFAVWGME